MRGRGAVLGLVLGAASSPVVGGVAAAADDVVAAAPVSLEAPVGIAAVAFGVVGLVVGLVRRRKAALARGAAEGADIGVGIGVAVVVGGPLTVGGVDGQLEVRPAATGA